MRKKNNAFLYWLDLYKLCKQINNSVHNKKTLMQNTGFCAYVKFVGFANFVQNVYFVEHIHDSINYKKTPARRTLIFCIC